jgi:hypothetical protein
MSRAKVAVVCGLMALLVSACGIQSKPEAGATLKQFRKSPGNESLVIDPRIKQNKCLKQDKLRYHDYYADGVQHLFAIQVGSSPAGPTLVYYPTAGAAQSMQVEGKETGAAVIGSWLVYPKHARIKLLNKIRVCAAIGVAG